MSVDFTELRKAIQTLDEVVKLFGSTDISSTIIRDSSVQRFEYTFELTWKTLRRYIDEYYGRNVKHAYGVFKYSVEVGLIDDEEFWRKCLEVRNKTSHEYVSEYIDEAITVIAKFLPIAKETLKRMEDKLAA